LIFEFSLSFFNSNRHNIIGIVGLGDAFVYGSRICLSLNQT
jgi:hypothetical protein